MNSDMFKPEKFSHLHLVYHFTVPVNRYVVFFDKNGLFTTVCLNGKCKHNIKLGTDSFVIMVVCTSVNYTTGF